MSLVHNRAIYVRCEDAGAGPGNTREVNVNYSGAATARPVVSTVGFSNTTTATALGAPSLAANTGQTRSVTNRSRRYWLTLAGTINAAAIQIPIAPMQTIFLPDNLVCTAATMTMNSTWPLPAGAAAMPTQLTVASSTQNLTFDMVLEQ